MKLIWGALLVAAALPATAASTTPAASSTVASLMEQCAAMIAIDDRGERTDENYMKAAFCLGFMDGEGQSAAISSDADRCMDSITVAQRARVFIKWAQESPQMHHLPAVLGVQRALARAFPCKD